MDNEFKFVKQDAFTELLEKRIKEINDKTRISNSVFSSLEITECPRKLVYKSMGIESTNNPSNLHMITQELIENKWRDLFFHCKDMGNIIDIDLRPADCHYNLCGKITAVLHMNDVFVVVKVHGVNNELFSKIKKRGAIKKHIIDLLVNMWLMEESHGLLIYENTDNLNYKSFHILPYKPVIDSVRKKCLEMLDHKIQGDFPKRPYKDFGSQECTACGFLKRCSDDEKKK